MEQDVIVFDRNGSTWRFQKVSEFHTEMDETGKINISINYIGEETKQKRTVNFIDVSGWSLLDKE